MWQMMLDTFVQVMGVACLLSVGMPSAFTVSKRHTDSAPAGVITTVLLPL
jgi:hypothetical protein